MDTTCAACTDFFRYANGGWAARTEIPAQYTSYGIGREVMDRNEALLRKILDACRTPTAITAPAGFSAYGSARC